MLALPLLLSVGRPGLMLQLLLLLRLLHVSGADESTCLRPRASLLLDAQTLLKDHIVGVLTGRCTGLTDCNGHGYCRPLTQVCVCHDKWGGVNDITDHVSADCSTRVCPAGRSWVDVPTSTSTAHFWRECSSMGKCDRSTGLCECDPGFTGSACQRAVCPNDCSGRGQCLPMREAAQVETVEPLGVVLAYDNLECSTTWDANAISGCVCESSWPVGLLSGQMQLPEFFGADCSQRRCPSGDDPLTLADETDCELRSGNGAAAGSGAAGNRCYVECANRGICNTRLGTCECFDGFYGVACTQMNALAKSPNVLTHVL